MHYPIFPNHRSFTLSCPFEVKILAPPEITGIRYQDGGLTLSLVTLVFVKGWVAKVSARMHTWDVRAFVCVCLQNPLWKVCAMCVHAARFQACHCHKSYIRRAICDLTFAHFLEQNSQKMPFFILKTILERPYPVLEHLFLF